MDAGRGHGIRGFPLRAYKARLPLVGKMQDLIRMDAGRGHGIRGFPLRAFKARLPLVGRMQDLIRMDAGRGHGMRGFPRCALDCALGKRAYRWGGGCRSGLCANHTLPIQDSLTLNIS